MAKSKPKPKSKTKPALTRKAISGPLTLAEARAIVSATNKTVAPASASRGGVRRGPMAAAVAVKSVPQHEIIEAERRQQHAARETLEKERLQDYKATLQLLKKRGVVGIPTAADVDRGPRRAIGAPAAQTGPLQVFAEGDSWFDYPPFYVFKGGGVIPRLEKRLGVPILNMAKAGDEVRFMLGVEQRKKLAQRLSKGCPAGGTWDALLFSGGGNDIVGDPMSLWINAYNASLSPEQQINQARFDGALAMVRTGYQELIALRNQLSPTTHLVFHGYDYAIPDGRNVCFMGPWLKPTFDLRGFPTQGTIRFNVVKAMLIQLATLLQQLADANPGVTFLKTQGTLTEETKSWHNELHPSTKGFDSITSVFHQALKALFPTRVL